MNGEEGRRPAPGGRGRSGWAAALGCGGRWPGCSACPRLCFDELGRCGPSPGVLRGLIYFCRGWGVGAGPSPAPAGRVSGARRSARPGRQCVSSRSQSLFFARRRRRVRQQGASRGFWAKCSTQDAAPVTPICHLQPVDAGICTSRQSAICGRRPSRHFDVRGLRPYFAQSRQHVRQQDAPRVFP